MRQLAGALQQPHQAEVSQERLPRAAEEDVPGLDVPMHHLLCVDVAHGIRHLGEALQDLGLRLRDTARRSLPRRRGLLEVLAALGALLDRRAEVAAVREVHHQAEPAGAHEDLTSKARRRSEALGRGAEADHVGMPHPAQSHGLPHRGVAGLTRGTAQLAPDLGVHLLHSHLTPLKELH